ncbi:MAG: hypothetical protein VX084_09325, partial [Planctomycetota bacterium]|nr:hypothetical protein [Planctomycetota bacterium]
RGHRVAFPVNSGEMWQTVQIDISETRRLYQVRIDVSDGPGMATIADLELRNAKGETLLSWPDSE